MNPRLVPFVLVASFAVACRSEGEHPPPVEQAVAKPVEAPKSAPMVLVHARPAAPVAQPEAPAAVANDARAERFAALKQEHEDAMNAYYAAIDKAMGDNKNPTQEQWKEIQAKVKEPDAPAFLARAQKLVDEDPADITAFHALDWLLDFVSAPEERRALLAQLEQNHLNRPEMADLCDRVTQDGRGLLEKLLASSPHREVRGRACFALAEGCKNDIESAERLKSKDPAEVNYTKRYLSDARVAELEHLDVDKAHKDMEAFYERAANEFGDVKLGAGSKRESTLGKRAGAALYEIRHLSVGMPVPEIEAKDLDSVAFKLSDYRGKVVLLDFWGNW